MAEKTAKKILLVEDDEKLSAAVVTLLKSQGYLVKVAFDSTYAMTRAVSDKPDLIVLDLGIPAGGGFFTLDNLKASKNTINIPVLVFTAHTEKEMEQKALGKGAAAFVRKPFDPKILLDQVKLIVNGEPGGTVDGVPGDTVDNL